MEVYDDYRQITGPDGAPWAVTIGNFDGVHRGHREVLGAARAGADARGMELAVLTFEPHPASLLRRDMPPMRLASPARKLELLAACGVQTVLAQRFDREFAALEPEAFAGLVLAGAMRAGLVMVGSNFRYGASRGGDVSTLRATGRELGFEVAALDIVSSGGELVSSSRIRSALAAGDLRIAAAMLGRPYEISGVVVRGKGEGRRLGFPTVNLGEVDVMLPAAGIFAAWCRVDGARRMAAVYIGDRPTLGHGPSVEAHLIGVDADLYGARLRLELTERVREERRFEDVAALRAQVALDVARVEEILEGAEHA